MDIEIARTTLLAPFEGIIGAGHVELGDFVRIGDVAATIVDLDPILAVGSVSERQIGGLRKGGVAEVTLVDGTSHTGAIRFIAPVADPQTRTYRVELEIENSNYGIRDGITADIRFPLGEARAHLASPSILTQNDDGIVGVRSVDSEDIVRFKPVEILADEPRGVWLGGLPDRVRLIVVGQEFVIDRRAGHPGDGRGRGTLGRSFMSIIDAGLNRSRTVIASLVLLLVAGAFAFNSIPKEAEPDVNIPIIYVTLSHQGISPEDSERLRCGR